MWPVIRIARHAWLDAADSRRALPAAAAQRLADRIAASECRHSGQIRVCVEAGLPLHRLWPPPQRAAWPAVVRQRALTWFGRLQVWDTAANNGVLIYVLLAERAIEIVADRGVQAHLGADWAAHLATLQAAFRRGDFEAGLGAVVDEVGAALERCFPRDPAQPAANELPNTVVLC